MSRPAGAAAHISTRLVHFQEQDALCKEPGFARGSLYCFGSRRSTYIENERLTHAKNTGPSLRSRSAYLGAGHARLDGSLAGTAGPRALRRAQKRAVRFDSQLDCLPTHDTRSLNAHTKVAVVSAA